MAEVSAHTPWDSTIGHGIEIPLGAGRTLRVLQVLPGTDPAESGVLVVEAV